MIKNIIKRIASSVLAAAICITSLADGFSNSFSIKASAAEQISVNPPDMKEFVSRDDLVKQAAQLLGARYEWGHKGYYNTYYANSGAMSPANIKNANRADGFCCYYYAECKCFDPTPSVCSFHPSAEIFAFR